MNKIKVEVWTDIMCPYCYIGKIHYERALAQFPHADEVELVIKAFQLNPNLPDKGNGYPVVDYLVNTAGYPEANVKQMFAYIEQNSDRLLARDAEAINRVVENSVRIKANIVSMDEREKGERRKLNLGHTWGHAVEKLTHLPHGEAVSIGMMFAAQLSAQKGLMSADEVKRLKALLEKLQLPTSASFDRATAFTYMLKDKKKEKSTIHFVLMEGIGSTRVEALSTTELQDCYKKMEATL